MKKVSKKITLDDVAGSLEALARMTKEGFDAVDKKSDERFKVTVDEFDRIRSDIRDIKTTLGPLVRVVAQHDNEMNEMRFRLLQLERKVGIEFKK